MSMTDPVADMLTRLRNANSAHHDSVSMPSSQLKTGDAEILIIVGYISSWKEEDARVCKILVMELKLCPQRHRSIAGLRRTSNPGLRVSAKSNTLPHVLGGLGIASLSTS